MELDSLYQEVILEHYKRPLHKSLKANPTIQVQHINTSCGDEITLNLHTDGKTVFPGMELAVRYPKQVPRSSPIWFEANRLMKPFQSSMHSRP
jgi:hypothetical protein